MNKDILDFLNKLKSSDLEIFKNRYDKFKELLEEIKNFLDPRLYEELNEFYLQILEHITEKISFSIHFIVDTNILFAEILVILKGYPSFLYKVLKFPFLKLNAPPRIIDELYKTIEEHLPGESDKQKAFTLAKSFLSKINILDTQKLEDWDKAYRLLAKYDEDDVHFLALGISLNVQGIITRDKHFKKQKEIKTWLLGETGRMAFEVSKGAFSLYILDKSINNILPKIFYFLILAFEGYFEVVKELYDGINYVGYKFKEKYAELPKWLQIGIPLAIISLPLFILIFSKSARKNLRRFLIDLKEDIEPFIKNLYDIVKRNFNIFKEIIKELLPFISIGMDGIGYLFYNTNQLLQYLHYLQDPQKM